MAHINTLGPRFGSDYVPSSFVMRFGQRELFIGPDFRNRFSQVNPVFDCRAGIEAGYLEIVLFSKWLIVLSRAK